MKWIKNWAMKKYNLVSSVSDQAMIRDDSQKIAAGNGHLDSEKSINFTIFKADGGHIIQHYSRDHRGTDRSSKLTIVNDNDDLGEVVTRIILLEALRS